LIEYENNPLVSILIPVYNGSNYLEEALESALKQSYHHVEIIVINDGSEDNGKTRLIVEKFLNRIKYFEHDSNKGVSAALNTGIKQALGTWVSWLSHDDLYHPDKIALQVSLINSLQESNLIIFCNYSIKNEIKGTSAPNKYKKSFSNSKEQNFRFWMLTDGWINGCTMLIPKKAIELYGGFNEKLLTVQDVDLWYRMSSSYNYHYLDRDLVTLRVHKEQDSHKKSEIWLQECNNFYSRIALDFTARELVDITGSTSLKGYQLIVKSLKCKGYFLAAKSVESTIGKHQFYYISKVGNEILKILIQFNKLVYRVFAKVKIIIKRTLLRFQLYLIN
jgi:glycosyltransferase involved in cell wall biosynthesis